MAHHRFLARTVMLGEKTNINAAYSALRKIMSTEKQIKDITLKKRYEKPTIRRRRLKYESSLKLYNSEMKDKLDFIMKGERKVTPWT